MQMLTFLIKGKNKFQIQGRVSCFSFNMLSLERRDNISTPNINISNRKVPKIFSKDQVKIRLKISDRPCAGARTLETFSTYRQIIL